MPVNPYFHTYTSIAEQTLIEDLANESTLKHGIDFYYVARDLNNFDKIYGEDDQSSYTNAWIIAGYLKNVFGYAGGGELLSKFGGIQIPDQIIISIPMREFRKEIAEYSSLTRAREGDLLYFPLHKKCFQISFVNQMEFFYALGHLNTWECTCELFQYSGEKFNTGIPEVDKLQAFSENLFDWALEDENGTPLIDEAGELLTVDSWNPANIDVLDDSQTLTDDLNDILDFSEDDPFTDYPNKRI